MRKVMMAVMAVAAAAMVTTGCSNKSEVQRQHSDMVEARIDMAKAKQEQNKDPAKARIIGQAGLEQAQQSDQNTLAARQALLDQQGNLSATQAPDINNATPDNGELSGTGGSGLTMEKAEVVKGTVQATTEKTLTLVVPGDENRIMSFKADDSVAVTRNNQPLTMQSLKAGDEVRASYQVDENGLRMLRDLEVLKISPQHPAMMTK